MSHADDLKRLMAGQFDGDNISEKLSEIYVTAVHSMTLCTVLAHKKAGRLPEAGAHVLPLMTAWLQTYASEHGNPLKDIDEFHRRLVLRTRDETEKFLGVSREQIAARTEAKAKELMNE